MHFRTDAVPAVVAQPPQLDRYRSPHLVRSLLELLITVGPLVLLWLLAWTITTHGHPWGLLFTVPAAAFLVRLFMIQHDCGHGSFFSQTGLNTWVGRAIGVLTLTPYAHWRREHALHHATAGDLDRRGSGDVEVLTVDEFRALNWQGRLGYRLFRHPAVMFGLGPAYVFLLRHRLPVGDLAGGWRPWASAMATNLAIVVLAAGFVWAGGLGPFLLVQLPITLMAATIGVWLFYVQHQFEGVVWVRSAAWTRRESALTNCSHYHLPGLLGWFTGNIGVHHVHHLNSRIPFYRLRQVLRDNPELDRSRLSVSQAFRGVRLALWDEAGRKLISFRELKAVRRSSPSVSASLQV